MIAIQGVSLWHFYIYISCTLVWLIPFIILPLPQLHFLKWLRQFSMFHICTCIESTSIIFTLLYPLHISSPSHYSPSLNMICFTFLSFVVLVSIHYSVVFYLQIYCTLISLTLSSSLPYPFPNPTLFV
jgi:hypothetical protein